MDDLKGLLDRLEGELAALKNQYDLFFQGGRRGEPTRERKELENKILVLSRRSLVNSADQLRFSNLQGKYWSFVNLWARIVRDFEEGRLRRDRTGALTRVGTERPPAAESGPGNGACNEAGARIEAAPKAEGNGAAAAEGAEAYDAAHLDRVAKELLETRRKCGLAADPSELDALRDSLSSRAKEISASAGGKKVEFHVTVEDGKPKIKARLG